MQQFENGKIHSQLLLIPEVLDVESEVEERVLDGVTELEKLGFIAESFGKNKVILRSIPSVLSKSDPKKLFEDVVEFVGGRSFRESLIKACDGVIARIACHSSIRSGVELKREEIYALLEQVDKIEGGAFCPHGRPIARRFTKYDIERWFGRVM